MTDWIFQQYREAAAKVVEELKKPMPESGNTGDDSKFSPWKITPCLYGHYDRAFDKMAIQVLKEIQTTTRIREDLAADMFREILCRANLCDYGTSPRLCFATTEFRELLPTLIKRWETWDIIHWAGE